MMKSRFLCCCTSGLLDMSVFCQLLHPLLFLLLKLIGIWIVVFLRAIGDQELCYGFMLEIMGHDGIQEFSLRQPWSIYQEVWPRVLWGLDPKRGGTVTICNVLELAGLTSHGPDQMCRSWKHSGRTMHNAG